MMSVLRNLQEYRLYEVQRIIWVSKLHFSIKKPNFAVLLDSEVSGKCPEYKQLVFLVSPHDVRAEKFAGITIICGPANSLSFKVTLFCKKPNFAALLYSEVSGYCPDYI